MNQLLANTKIATKIIVPIIILAIVGLAGVAYSGWQMKRIDTQYSQIIAQQSNAIIRVARFRAALQRLGYTSYMVETYGEGSEGRRRALEAHRETKTQITNLAKDAQSFMPPWAADIGVFKSRADQLVELSDQAIETVAGGDLAQGLVILQQMDPQIISLAKDMSDFNDGKIAGIETTSNELTANVIGTIVMTASVVGLTVLLAMLASLFITNKGITTPLSRLRELMEKLANADFTVDVTGQDRKDEVGQMAKTVQVFKENGIRARDLDQEATRLREHNEQERSIVAREQERVVAQLADGLARLSDGDLAFTLNDQFAAEYEKLRADFNGAMSKLKQTMQMVSGNTHGIRGGADEISQAADDLSRRTEQQAASLEETAAALDEITATVRTTAENANEARRVVAEASESAKHSGEVVGQAVEAMAKIEKSSQQISQIIGVIDEIAFQTNLLALNAGVEAARAGDAGRGFAVVASEVRALAQRSAEAAKEIKTLISASSVQVDQGVSLVAETGTALKGIVDQVTRINHLVADIAASAQEQATGLQQVNTAVNQMDQVTQQNAAMVEESTAASHSLAQETEQLSRLIGQFRTGEAQAEEAAPMRKRQSHQAAPGRSPQKTQTALKTTGYGGAALKSQHQPAEDGWEEF